MDMNGREHQCWHEVGHAMACILSKGSVELIELINDKNSIGLARARCITHTQEMRCNTACGGFAIEYILYKKGYWDINEQEFIQMAFINSSMDKITFFDGNYEKNDGFWPKEMDIIFRDHSIRIAEKMSPYFLLMECMVKELLHKKKMDSNDIDKLIQRYT